MHGKDDTDLIIAFKKARAKSKGGDPFDAGSRDPMERGGEDREGGHSDMDSVYGSLGDDAIDASESGDGLAFAHAVLRIIHAHQDACDSDCPGEAGQSDDGDEGY